MSEMFGYGGDRNPLGRTWERHGSYPGPQPDGLLRARHLCRRCVQGTIVGNGRNVAHTMSEAYLAEKGEWADEVAVQPGEILECVQSEMVKYGSGEEFSLWQRCSDERVAELNVEPRIIHLDNDAETVLPLSLYLKLAAYYAEHAFSSCAEDRNSYEIDPSIIAREPVVRAHIFDRSENATIALVFLGFRPFRVIEHRSWNERQRCWIEEGASYRSFHSWNERVFDWDTAEQVVRFDVQSFEILN